MRISRPPITDRADAPDTNWAGTHRYRARTIHRPSTLDELRSIVAAAPRIRALGSRHSFTDMPDGDELVSLDDVPPDVSVDRDAGTVTAGGAVRYGDLAGVLRAEGLALHNLASLPHICVAGATATATSRPPSPRSRSSPPPATSSRRSGETTTSTAWSSRSGRSAP